VRRLAAASTITTMALSACSLLVDSGGLAGGAGAGALDGAAAVDGTGGSDAPPGIASAEGGALDGASSSSPCASVHTFCDDFDMPGDLSTRWPEIEMAAGPLGFDTERSVSAPRSVRVSLHPGAGNPESKLSRNFPLKQGGSARVELDLYLGSAANNYQEIDPVGLQLDPPPAGYAFQGVYFSVEPNRTRLEYFADKTTGDNLYTDTTVPALSRDAWHHLVFTISYASMPPRATLSVDDGPLATVVLNAASSPTTLKAQFGAVYTAALNVDWPLNFDNVVVDIP
jgi:hypothetical protein